MEVSSVRKTEGRALSTPKSAGKSKATIGRHQLVASADAPWGEKEKS